MLLRIRRLLRRQHDERGLHHLELPARWIWITKDYYRGFWLSANWVPHNRKTRQWTKRHRRLLRNLQKVQGSCVRR